MIGRMIHNAINQTALKIVLAPVVGVAYVGYKATKMGIEAANKGLEYIGDCSHRAEQAKRAADPIYRARKEREEKEAELAAWQAELQRRRVERRCICCGKGLGIFDKINSKEIHASCVGKQPFWL